MNKIYIFIILTLATLSVNAIDLKSKNPFKKGTSEPFDYTAWADTTALPAQINGINVIYPKSIEGQPVISGSINVPGKSADQLFANVINHVIDTFDIDNEKEGFMETPAYNNKSFSFCKSTKQGSNNTETSYTRVITMQFGDGVINYTITNIDAKYREKGILPRTLALEKLNPATNPRHRELIDEYVVIQAQEIETLKQSALGTDIPVITHFADVLKNNVTIGMTPLEVKLILGVPVTTREMSEERMRWVYPDNNIILFKDGKVNRVMGR